MSRGQGIRVGDVELGHGTETILLIIHSRWPGSTQLTPDEAEALANELLAHAAAVRKAAREAGRQ